MAQTSAIASVVAVLGDDASAQKTARYPAKALAMAAFPTQSAIQ